MRPAMWKITFREIKRTLGRYLTILAIVALGVGFFVGLKITRPVMIATVDAYVTEQSFYDYEVISGLGFTEDDVAAFAALKDVRTAAGSISTDVLYVSDEDELVMAVHSITEGVNEAYLVAGRMPESADECVVDSRLMSEEDIGTYIEIAADNDGDTLDMLTYDSYQVVGIIQSPLYINFERGSSSIGSGSVAGFMFIPEEGFDCDYYTEIYLKYDMDYEIYSDEYEEYLEEHTDEADALMELRVENRRNVLAADAEEEIADAEATLTDAYTELTDGEEELASAKQEAAEAFEELESAREELESGEEELAVGQAELEADEAALEAAKDILGADEYATARTQIDVAGELLAVAEAELENGWKEYEEGLAEYEEGLKEIEDAEAELADGWEEYYDGLAELEEARQEVEDLKTEEILTYLLGRDSNVGYACFESDSMIVDNIANIFPVFFFAVALLVCITTMNRMVDEGRTQIGVLKALGYGRGAIIGEYIGYAGSAALIGGLLGFTVGSIVFPMIIWYAYGIMYDAAGTVLVFSAPYLLLSIFVALACSLGATFFSCYVEFMSVPSELMRPKAPKVGKRVLVERITPLWRHLSFLTKVSLRNVFRYKKRFLMMVLGVSGCTALLLAALGMRDSVMHVADSQYEKIQVYDIEAVLKDGADEEKMETLEEDFSDVAEDILYLHEDSADLIANGVTKSATMIVPLDAELFAEYWKLYDEDGDTVAFPGVSEAVLTEKLADKLGVEVGDTITLRNGDLQEMTVTVSGIATNYVYNYIYISKETCESGLKTEPEYKYLCIKTPEGEDVHEESTVISGQEDVLTITINEDVQTRLSSMMDSLNAVVVLVIVCAALLAFIVLYNLTNINIIERVREIATLKVLGFYPNETSQYVFRENFILTAVGTAVGLLLGIWLHRFIMVNIDVDIVSFDITILPASYVLAVILTFVFALMVDFAMYFKLEKINMAESLKTIE